jgi:hypothetical protein
MKKLLLFAAIAVFVQNSYGQEATSAPKSTGGFIISVGPSFPMGDFGDDDIDYDDDYTENELLGAGTGIAINFDYILPLSENGIGLFFGVGINYNGLKADYKDDFEDEFEFDEDDITYQRHFSIPVSAGLNYTHNFDETIGLFGNLGLVANVMKITDQEIETSYGDLTTTYDAKTNIGLRIGGGLILNNRFYFSLNYINAGKTKIKYEEEFNAEGPYDDDTYKYSNKSKISYLNLTVGIKL